MGATGVALGVHEQGAGGGDAAVAAAAAVAATEPKKVSHVPLFLGAEDSAGALSTSVSKLGNVMPALLCSKNAINKRHTCTKKPICFLFLFLNKREGAVMSHRKWRRCQRTKKLL